MTNEQKQCLLRFLGYYKGEVDGIWGTLSQAAAVAFQKDFGGITKDNTAGTETQKALLHAVANGMPVKESIRDNVGSKDSWWDEIEFFTRDEFACKCGDYHAPYCDGFPAEPKEQLVRIADKVRKHFGVPVDVISGLRCPQHNADSDGVANSQHMYGEAADIYVRGVAPSVVEAFLDKVGGVRHHYTIKGSNNVHFDIPQGAR